jgi:hypothetical protein
MTTCPRSPTNRLLSFLVLRLILKWVEVTRPNSSRGGGGGEEEEEHISYLEDYSTPRQD